MIEVNSYSDLINKIKDKEKAYLLLYRQGSEKSDCAYSNITEGSRNINNLNLFAADVNIVNDIHAHYNITTVPSLLEFRNSEFLNVIKGCNDSSLYKALFENSLFYAEQKSNGNLTKRILVYSTPSCSWCNTLKAYLKQNNIAFIEIDVSRDQKAADELVKRSGQMGVPQTDINGEIIVGFDKPRISRLLGLKS